MSEKEQAGKNKWLYGALSLLVAVGLFGLGLGLRGHGRLATCLALGLLCQLYISSVATDWHGAWGFCARRLTHATPVIAWGVAVVLGRLARGDRRRLFWATAALSPLVLWNALFLYQVYHHLIPYHRALTWHELIGDKFHIAASRASCAVERHQRDRSSECGWRVRQRARPEGP